MDLPPTIIAPPRKPETGRKLLPKEYVVEIPVEASAGFALEGKKILLPRAAVARDLVPAELSKRGAQVDVVEAYRIVPPVDAASRAKKIFGAKDRPDWITFTSSSTVKNTFWRSPERKRWRACA